MKKWAYYNDADPAACAITRELIRRNIICDGEVDERSIKDVTPDDLKGFKQVHLFSGGSLWSVAARLAGWPDDEPLWTASCPCQPFSAAGQGGGTDDPRHLWPDVHRLIRAIRPPVIMGEQVAAKAGYGWFDGVRADLAREGYASRSVDFPACSVDAPHQRNRQYWIALGHTVEPGLEGQRGHGDTSGRPEPDRPVATPDGGEHGTYWSDAEWIVCHDNKARRAKPGVCFLVDGLPGRVDLWRVGGNAIVPEAAKEVIAAFIDVYGLPSTWGRS